jgi:hypothetical protein
MISAKIVGTPLHKTNECSLLRRPINACYGHTSKKENSKWRFFSSYEKLNLLLKNPL